MNSTPIDSEVDTYWRTWDTLWVYGSEPEVGLGTAEGSPAAMTHVANAGARLVRFGLFWDDYTEPNPYGANGGYRIHELNWVVGNAKEKGLEPVVVVHGLGGGIGQPHPDMDEADAEFNRRFGAFLGEAVRVLPDVRFWEIWNEIDVAGNADAFGPRSDRYAQGQTYAATLKVAYDSIKANDPNDWVLVSSLTGAESWTSNSNPGVTSWRFLEGMYAAGGGAYYDFMNVHAYGSTPTSQSTYQRSPGWVGGQLRNKVQSLEGKVGRPIWLTEFGAAATTYEMVYGSLPPDAATADAHQRDWWAGALNVIADPSSPYTKAIGFTLWTPEGSGAYESERFGAGVMYGDWYTPSSWIARPAYHTISASGINPHVFSQPTLTGAVTIFAPNKNPVGYSYTRSGDFVTITGVAVDKLYPTKIPFASGPPTGGGCTDPSQILCGDNDPW